MKFPDSSQEWRSAGWLFTPWVDLFFLANILWPLLVLAQHDAGFHGRPAVQFWQVYFVTTPHRWITLAIVFLDRKRFRERPVTFVGMAILAVSVCLGIRMTTGTLTCLLAVDYVWNAWHFAAQHHGIYRIYGRRLQPERQSGLQAEKWLLRLFLLYVILRVAGSTLVEQHAVTAATVIHVCDWLATAIPLGLLWQDLRSSGNLMNGRLVYLVSVSGLYLSLLWAVRCGRPEWVLSLATASAIFHATEYLAIVSWSVSKSGVTSAGAAGDTGWLLSRWGITLGLYIVMLGSVGWLMDQRLLDVWLTVNVIVAFLHYGYDGLIWRRSGRPPAVSRS